MATASKDGSNSGGSWAEQLRQSIGASDQSRYAIAAAAGIEQSVIARFMAGGGITLATAGKIGRVLGLAITPARTRE